MDQTLNFDGGLTCAMQCSNLSDSVSWYQETLGFQLLYRVEEMGWAELQSSVVRVNIGLSQVEQPEVKGGATLTFGVVALDEARKKLEHSGVEFDGESITIPEMVRLATFYDPDGNKLMLYQDLSKT